MHVDRWKLAHNEISAEAKQWALHAIPVRPLVRYHLDQTYVWNTQRANTIGTALFYEATKELLMRRHVFGTALAEVVMPSLNIAFAWWIISQTSCLNYQITQNSCHTESSHSHTHGVGLTASNSYLKRHLGIIQHKLCVEHTSKCHWIWRSFFVFCLRHTYTKLEKNISTMVSSRVFSQTYKTVSSLVIKSVLGHG